MYTVEYGFEVAGSLPQTGCINLSIVAQTVIAGQQRSFNHSQLSNERFYFMTEFCGISRSAPLMKYQTTQIRYENLRIELTRN